MKIRDPHLVRLVGQDRHRLFLLSILIEPWKTQSEGRASPDNGLDLNRSLEKFGYYVS